MPWVSAIIDIGSMQKFNYVFTIDLVTEVCISVCFDVSPAKPRLWTDQNVTVWTYYNLKIGPKRLYSKT